VSGAKIRNISKTRSNAVRAESHPFYQRLGYARTKTQHYYRKALDAAPPQRRP